MPQTPEDSARDQIDQQLIAAGWVIQDTKVMNLTAGPGVAVREFPLASGHGDRKVLGVVDVTVTANLKRAERLWQSMLQSAFSSKLAPQSPNHEPARILLECILAERENIVIPRRNARPSKSMPSIAADNLQTELPL